MHFFKGLLNRVFGSKMPVEQAYNLWARTYDEQENNLLLYLDEALMFEGSQQIEWKGKDILDFGCGTGRHWQKLGTFQPNRLIGVDISAEMLRKLKEKYPLGEVYLTKGHDLPMFSAEEFDVILSNLTLGYVKEIVTLLREWARLLRPQGIVLITDLHPSVLKKGGKRNFKREDRLIEIQNYLHEPKEIRDQAMRNGLRAFKWEERRIDESTKVFYEKANALALYQKMKGTPVMYKMGLVKEPS